jgi:hypothetical protein
MNGGGDFLSAMGWALRKYAWLVLAFIVGLGVLIPFLLNRGPTTYEAQAQVGPTDKVLLQPLDPLPRIGESVFNNGAVAKAVRDTLKLGPGATVSPKYVELVAAQDNLVFTVLGHDKNAQTAQKLANLAAATFTVELNKYSGSVGQFQVQHGAPLPATPTATLGGGKLAIAIGLLAGLIAGLAAVALIVVWRRPVLDAASAEEATNAPVYGLVKLPRGRGPVDSYSIRGLAPLCRRVLASSYDTVLLVSSPKGETQVRDLGSAMSNLLNRVQRTPRPTPGSGSQFGTGGASTVGWNDPGASSANGVPPRTNVQLHVATSDSLEQVATLPDSALTLLVVPRGTNLKELRDAAGEYFTGGAGGLVIVAQASRKMGRSSGGSTSRGSRGSSTPAQQEVTVPQ